LKKNQVFHHLGKGPGMGGFNVCLWRKGSTAAGEDRRGWLSRKKERSRLISRGIIEGLGPKKASRWRRGQEPKEDPHPTKSGKKSRPAKESAWGKVVLTAVAPGKITQSRGKDGGKVNKEKTEEGWSKEGYTNEILKIRTRPRHGTCQKGAGGSIWSE